MNMLAEIEIERLEALPAATMLRLVQKSKTAKKNAAAFQAAISAFPAFFAKLEALDIDVAFDLDNDYIAVRFTGDGERLGDVWGELRRHGFNTTARPEKGQTEFYSFWEREGYCRIFLIFMSSVCRRVKIGTRTVTKEEDIFETQCGEMPELEEQITPPALTVIEGGVDSEILF